MPFKSESSMIPEAFQPPFLLMPAAPAPVPVPHPNLRTSSVSNSFSTKIKVDLDAAFPNFSGLPASLPTAASINANSAMARGISQSGANRMYFQSLPPRGLPDQLVVSQFSPGQAKVLVDMMTPESASDSTSSTTSTSTSTSSTSTSTSSTSTST